MGFTPGGEGQDGGDGGRGGGRISLGIDPHMLDEAKVKGCSQTVVFQVISIKQLFTAAHTPVGCICADCLSGPLA